MSTDGSDADKSGGKSTTDSTTKTETAAQAAAAKAAELAKNADKAEKNGSAADKPGAASDAPGVKPPWQRGEELAPDTGGGIPPAPEAASKPKNPSTPKKKPLITGTAAPKVDDAAANGTDKDRFVESPTRSIGRSQIKAKDLPDLDEIHATPAVAASAARTSGGLGPRSAPTQVGPGGASRALRASVQIRRIDPWSTLKISAVLAVIGFFIWMIAVAMLYLLLDGMGVWSQVNSSVSTLTTDGGGSSDAIGAGTVFGWAFLLGVIDAILLTALASVGAFIYNLCADFIGGVEVTLADLD
ncbi:MAG TPA: DUF3566 domain-containing protein [Gordonia sp. (in: high G+C Gram-positive bacteria)]|mgnify:FL=1|uniref:DUF3566 domain-containing protein n=1 Tax=unclassified Gordonia (in: high G+C Gram-positive bacteria) TaxID=2657482 RepID=UPI0025C4EA46|nr:MULTISPECIES: DUF3566 domain-containing protein [unclassified Gordonia (in: high G+C Gram-positive bacteria)]HNP56450.1 DUF3566 domain-containing protein [Gordonia sp. (in: high G+C Gram-positive bacteria)]HRC50797.1 DUF3566 domain-containing protein [Gordonia sp. (in: high G+C Gram-positive bacteria)]